MSRLFTLTSLAMMAFAANSVLNRVAVAGGMIDPVSFALIRITAGALTLALLVLFLRRGAARQLKFEARSVYGVAGLLVYMLGFSVAYLSLDTGVGALILFGTVQITMFGGALAAKERVPFQRWCGAGLAFIGLIFLVAPGGDAEQPLAASVIMACAGIGWGIYSLAGRGVSDPLTASAWNFVISLPLALLAALLIPALAIHTVPSFGGAALAVLCGAVTSGLGYTLWYALVPQLGAARAAVAQLTVPLLAALGGTIFLGEWGGVRFVIACALILLGVFVAIKTRKQSA